MQDHHQTAHYPEARFHQILLALGVMLVLGLFAISDRFILVPPQTAVPRAHTVALETSPGTASVSTAASSQ